MIIPTSNRTPTQAQYFVAVCQQCGDQYTLGVTGTVMGCDECLQITRNPVDHTIINDPFNNDDSYESFDSDVFDRIS